MKKYLFLLFLSFLTIQISAQTNYYISASGNNNNNGQLATPWKTIQYGINSVNSNDTINILTGTYNEKISISKPGIYIRNYINNHPLLSGAGITTQVAMIEIINHSNIT